MAWLDCWGLPHPPFLTLSHPSSRPFLTLPHSPVVSSLFLPLPHPSSPPKDLMLDLEQAYGGVGVAVRSLYESWGRTEATAEATRWLTEHGLQELL